MKGWEFEVRFLSPKGSLFQLESVDAVSMVIAAQNIHMAFLIAHAMVRFSGDKSLPIIPLTPRDEIIGIKKVGLVGDSAQMVDLSALADDVSVYDGWCRLVEELGLQPYEVKFVMKEGKVLGFVPRDNLRHPGHPDDKGSAPA